jgi:SUN domain-containing protein 1/2
MHQTSLVQVIAMPDFALWSAGARIIPAFTSPTYDASQPKSWFQGLFTSHIQPEWHFPEVAISPGLNVGNCWPMNGSSGAIGISLARDISPQSITIEHVPRHLSLDSRSAPKHLEVWSPVLDGMSDEIKGMTTVDFLDFLAQLGHSPTDAKHHFVFFSEMFYDVLSVDHIQNFPLQQQFLHVPVIIVVVKSNWGNENFTCLYRIRVHGVLFPTGVALT